MGVLGLLSGAAAAVATVKTAVVAALAGAAALSAGLPLHREAWARTVSGVTSKWNGSLVTACAAGQYVKSVPASGSTSHASKRRLRTATATWTAGLCSYAVGAAPRGSRLRYR